MRTRRHPAENRERGSVSVFLAIAFLGLAFVVGLVVDGGAKIRAGQEADAAAAEAARAAVQQINVGDIMLGEEPTLHATRAAQAARDHLAQARVHGKVTVHEDRVVVTASTTRPTKVLSIVGIGHMSATASAEARLARGTG